MIMAISTLIVSLAMALMMNHIGCVSFQQKNTLIETEQFEFTVENYEIYEIKTHQSYLMKRRYKENPTKDYISLPESILIIADSFEIISLQKISHNYFSMTIQTSLPKTNQNSLIPHFIYIYRINANNYLFYKYKSQNQDQFNDLSTLIILQDKVTLSASDNWKVTSNGHALRRVIVKNQSKCYNGQVSNNQSCFGLTISNIGFFNHNYMNQLTFKVFKDYTKMHQIQYLEIMPYFQNNFILLAGGKKVVYTILSQGNSLDFLGVLEVVQTDITGVFGMSSNKSAYTFSNGTLIFKGGYQNKNNHEYIRKIENIKECVKLSDKFLICQSSNRDYVVLDQNCKTIKKINISQELEKLKLEIHSNILWKLHQKVIKDEINYYIKCQALVSQPQRGIKQFHRKYQLNQTQKYISDSLYQHQSIINTEKYYEKYADNFLINMMPSLSQIKQENCQSIKDYSGSTQMIINFTTKNWTACRVTISTTIPLLMQVDPELLQQSYRVIFCRIKIVQDSLLCLYGNVSLKDTLYLQRQSFYHMYILQNGNQHLNTVTLRSIRVMQLDKFADILFIVLIVILSAGLVIVVFVILKKSVLNILIYFELLNMQPEYTYPLNNLLRKIKLKKLIKKGYISYVKITSHDIKTTSHEEITSNPQGFQNEQVCCFCLQNLNKSESRIQIYCRHQYHAQCFEEWIGKQPDARCPYCKRQFNQKSKNDFYKDSLQLFKQST